MFCRSRPSNAVCCKAAQGCHVEETVVLLLEVEVDFQIFKGTRADGPSLKHAI